MQQIYNQIIKKHLVKSFTDRDDVYYALINYRKDCIINGLDDTISIKKYLNNYEYNAIIKAINEKNETKRFYQWFCKVFNITKG